MESFRLSRQMMDVEQILKSRFFLAPMAGITDMPYRMFMRELGAEVVTSELISAESYVHGSKKTRQMISIHESEHPTGIQIFGGRTEAMCRIAEYVESIGADFVDINFGCPAPKVTQSGAGSAMLRDPKRMEAMLREIKKSISIPLSIKIRTGWHNEEITASEILKVASDCGIAWLTCHGRTTMQKYEGKADWEIIRGLHQEKRLPVIGNGDIMSAEKAMERLNNEDCHAVMIGRAVLADPFIFLSCREKREGVKLERPRMTELIHRYFDLVMEYNHPRVWHTKLKKVYAWWATGYPGKGAFRKKLFSMGDQPKDLLESAEAFFLKHEGLDKQIDNLSFLKGGHG